MEKPNFVMEKCSNCFHQHFKFLILHCIQKFIEVNQQMIPIHFQIFQTFCFCYYKVYFSSPGFDSNHQFFDSHCRK